MIVRGKSSRGWEPGALSDAELIAILLRVGLPGVNAVELARQILNDLRLPGSTFALQCGGAFPNQRRRAGEGRAAGSGVWAWAAAGA